MYAVLSKQQALSLLADGITDVPNCLFDARQTALPTFESVQLGFSMAASWLYGRYYESGRIGVKFLVNKINSLVPSAYPTAAAHLKAVHTLRTYLQHPLGESSDHDVQIRKRFQEWCFNACNTRLPSTNAQWRVCVERLLDDALQFAEACESTLQEIERDDACEVIVQEWTFVLERHVPPETVDNLVHSIATDLGRSGVSPTKVRKRHYDEWMKQIGLLPPNAVVDIELRKVIEYSLLTDYIAVLPITGKDIIDRFELQPGPRVGELLVKALSIYESNPCDGDALLSKLEDIAEDE